MTDKKLRHIYKKAFFRTLRSILAALTVVAAVSVLIATLFMPVLKIHGSSMLPTLESGQIVVAFKSSNLKKGDLAAFYYGNKLLIKRVIATSGDWISVEENGDVYVNGKLIAEPYITEKSQGSCDVVFPLQVGDGQWFFMGDNRAASADSRMATIGTVSKEQLVGKVIFRILPFKSFGLIN